MITAADKHDLGRRRGIWVPMAEVQAHLACGWVIADEVEGDTHVLMDLPAQQQGRAA